MQMRALLRLTIFALLALVLTAPSSPAQTVDEIVTRHIAARGGRDKLTSIQTVKMTRTVASGIGTTLKVIVYKKRPDLMRVEQGPAQPGAAMTPRGINADAVWDMVQGKAVSRQPQLAAESREVDGDFDGLLVDWKEKGHTVTLAGREVMPGGEAFKLTVTLKSGLVRTDLPRCKDLPRSAAHWHPQPAERPSFRHHNRLRQLARRRGGEVSLRHHGRTNRQGTGGHTRHLHREDRDQRADGRGAVRGAGEVSGALNPP